MIYINAVKGLSALQLERDLDVQYKSAFVLMHKLRQSLMDQRNGTPLAGGYVGGAVRPANQAEERVDRRLAEHQNPDKRCVLVLRETYPADDLAGRIGGKRTPTFIIPRENQSNVGTPTPVRIATGAAMAKALPSPGAPGGLSPHARSQARVPSANPRRRAAPLPAKRRNTARVIFCNGASTSARPCKPWRAATAHTLVGQRPLVGQGMEVEAAIEAIGDSAEVAFGVLAEAEGMVGTAEAGFDIAQDRVHPVEQRQLFGLTPDHDRDVHPARRGLRDRGAARADCLGAGGADLITRSTTGRDVLAKESCCRKPMWMGAPGSHLANLAHVLGRLIAAPWRRVGLSLKGLGLRLRE